MSPPILTHTAAMSPLLLVHQTLPHQPPPVPHYHLRVAAGGQVGDDGGRGDDRWWGDNERRWRGKGMMCMCCPLEFWLIMGERMAQMVPLILRSLHSPPFSSRTPVGLHQTRPIQNAEFLALEWLKLSGDFLVTFQCMLVRLVSPMDFHQTSSQIPPQMTRQQQKV